MISGVKVVLTPVEESVLKASLLGQLFPEPTEIHSGGILPCIMLFLRRTRRRGPLSERIFHPRIMVASGN